MARLVSRPTRSSRAKGPIGNPHPPFMAVSMSSRVATPFSSSRTALLRYGNSRALTMNPAWSFTSTGVLPHASANALAAAMVVVGGGDGPDHLDQGHHRRRVEEVDAAHLVGPAGLHGQLDDRAASRCWWPGSVCSGQMRSSSEKRCFFTARSSTTDSMTRSQSASSPRSDTAVTRLSAASRSRLGQLALVDLAAPGTSPWPATMASAVLWARERSTTSKPCTATVSAIPEPMIPEPDDSHSLDRHGPYVTGRLPARPVRRRRAGPVEALLAAGSSTPGPAGPGA